MNVKGGFEGIEFTVSDPSHQPTNIWIYDQAKNDDNNTQRIIESYGTSWVVLAPAFLACRPPTWLWGGFEIWSSKGVNPVLVDKGLQALHSNSPDTIEFMSVFDERCDGIPPDSPTMRQLKTVFDAAAGPQVVKSVYTSQYQLARTLGWLMITEGMVWYKKKRDRGMCSPSRWSRCWLSGTRASMSKRRLMLSNV
jgi:hypothetical protein